MLGGEHPVSELSSIAVLVSPEALYGTEAITNAVEHASPGPGVGVGVRVGVDVGVRVGVGVVASVLRPRRGVGVGEGAPLAGVGAGERLPPRALASRSSNGVPSMRTESPPRRKKSLATSFIC